MYIYTHTHTHTYIHIYGEQPKTRGALEPCDRKIKNKLAHKLASAGGAAKMSSQGLAKFGGLRRLLKAVDAFVFIYTYIEIYIHICIYTYIHIYLYIIICTYRLTPLSLSTSRRASASSRTWWNAPMLCWLCIPARAHAFSDTLTTRPVTGAS